MGTEHFIKKSPKPQIRYIYSEGNQILLFISILW